jgi:hypothetical protein
MNDAMFGLLAIVGTFVFFFLGELLAEYLKDKHEDGGRR